MRAEEDELLVLALMQDAAAYLQEGLFDDAAEIMVVAEKLECGQDPFYDFAMDDMDEVSAH